VLGGDFNVTPEDRDVWDPVAAHGGTHVSPAEREALGRLREWGLVDAFRLHRQEEGRFSWLDYPAGMFHRNEGMRIDLLSVTRALGARGRSAGTARAARTARTTPSDLAPGAGAPEERGKPRVAGWEAATARRSARQRKARR